MNKFLVPFLLIFFIIHIEGAAQVSEEDWKKKVPNYAKQSVVISAEPDFSSDSFLGSVIKSAVNIYGYTISQHDGDNCPFHPTCSAFFIDAVTKKGVIEGTLLFADRFTRDANFYKPSGKYYRLSNGKFYNPVERYLLKSTEFIYAP
jgi:putative component of membrane protein insertase Oxa1/YidC/SpoIIIJ protein YidD